MLEEILVLKKNCKWELVPKLNDTDVVNCKWIYRLKKKIDGQTDRFKGRFVAWGFPKNMAKIMEILSVQL